jgi:hypothetical protein
MIELRFMTGCTMATAGDVDGGSVLIAEAIRKNARWRDMLHRLVTVELLRPDVVSAIEARLAAVSQRI